MRSAILLSLVVCLVFVAGPGRAQGGPSHVALLIGNSAYEFGPDLPNATRDAQAMAMVLRARGYRTVMVADATRSEVLVTLAQLRVMSRDAVQVVIYFSGHGVQTGTQSFLLMRETGMTWAEVQKEAIPLRVVLQAISDKPRQKIVILDACRENPAYETFDGSATSASFAPAGLMIAYAAQPGQAAYDGAGKLSPFTAGLLRQVAKAPVPLDEILRRVRVDVVRQTAGRQVPWVQSSLLQPAWLTAQTGG